MSSANEAPSSAREARCYLRGRGHGVLSTRSLRVAGYPYGSAVPFVPDQEARPVILVSRLAEHTKNLEADPRTSLLVQDDGDDVQAAARLTLLGDAARVHADAALRARFLRYQPRARQLLDLGDFSFWRIAPVTLRFIAGFGTIRWVGGADYAAPAQALAEAESRIVAQLNTEYADALRLCCLARLGSEPTEAQVLGIDCDGFDVRADAERLRFDFAQTAGDADAVRHEFLRLAQDAAGR